MPASPDGDDRGYSRRSRYRSDSESDGSRKGRKVTGTDPEGRDRNRNRDRDWRHEPDRPSERHSRRGETQDDRPRRRRESRERSSHAERSRSPGDKRSKRPRDYLRSRSPKQQTRDRRPLPSQDQSFRGEVGPAADVAPPVQKEKPNFKPTGLLAKEANTVAGTTTVLKYHEPPEARNPPAKEQWRMYVFKQKDLLDTVYLHQRSCWLFGRDKHVTDVLLEHPSISKQHAAIQFRHQTTTNEFGDKTNRVKPYLIDLESANGTKLNGKQIEASRYVELVDQDMIAFGDSEREYVLMLPPPEK